VEKPLWSLSSYAPAKYEPNLITGLDMSFEELRVNAVLALHSNTVPQYVRLRPFSIVDLLGRLVERKDQV
jgi:hypothetical protein